MRRVTTNMKNINRLEHKLEEVFNIMAFVRTIVCLIILLVAVSSCGTIEFAYSEAQWTAHRIHFQENMDMPNCQWCIDYNNPIP